MGGRLDVVLYYYYLSLSLSHTHSQPVDPIAIFELAQTKFTQGKRVIIFKSSVKLFMLCAQVNS